MAIKDINNSNMKQYFLYQKKKTKRWNEMVLSHRLPRQSGKGLERKVTAGRTKKNKNKKKKQTEFYEKREAQQELSKAEEGPHKILKNATTDQKRNKCSVQKKHYACAHRSRI